MSDPTTGTIVLNQDTAPMSGIVIPPPDGTNDPGYVWVHWQDGRETREQTSDLTLTAHTVLA